MSAPTRLSVLITEAGTFLGIELAKAYLAQNATVYGVCHSELPHNLLQDHNFTLLELDLTQPLPAYLPEFDLVFDLSIIKHSKISLFSQMPTVPHQTKNIIANLKEETRLFVFSKITTSEDLYEYLTHNDQSLRKRLKLILLGDLYGPGMPQMETNELANLIFQAVKGDKVILEDEGLRQIYPAYIDDVVKSVVEITTGLLQKEIYHLTSERAKTALTVAYEIQDVARLVLNKELGLFFTGPQKQISHEAEIITGHDISLKTDLRDGLKTTLEELSKHHSTDNTKKEEPPPRFVANHQTSPSIEEKRKSSHIMKNFSKFNPDVNFRAKNIVLIILLISFLLVGKTALDLYLGVTNLKAAKSQLVQGGFKEARENAQNARKSFHAAANKTKFIKSLNNITSAMETGSSSVIYFTDGSEAISKNFYTITHSDSEENQDKDTISANFQKATALSAYAANLLPASGIKGPFGNKISAAKQEFIDLGQLSQSAYELTNLIDDITGSGAKKTYLILLQNNTELRPGGGFIGNYATVEFNQGKLGEIKVDDIYNIDGQLKEKIEPPKELKDKLGTTQLYLRDSNWSPDNALNAQTERELFKKETGKDVDGVITIDLSFMQEILSAVGSIRLEDYKEDINARNLFEKGEYYSEIGFYPGSTQKKDFFGALGRALIARVIQDDKQTGGSNSQITIIKAVKNALREKHIMLTFDNPNVSTYVATHGWNQPIPPLTFNPADDTAETRDFLAISEANLGANKVNRTIERKISYEMTIGRDVDLVAKLKISYTNKSQADTWPGGKYTNFLRIYVPGNPGLLSVKNGDVTDIKTVQTQSQGNLTAFSTFVEVPTKSTKEIELTYRIPKNIKLETNPTYHIYFSKQPGTDNDPLTFTFNLPQYLSIKSIISPTCHTDPSPSVILSEAKNLSCDNVLGKQNIKTETDLSQDREFSIEVTKR